MRVGSLFSGIGGMDLGLEWAGMEIVWQSEIDEYASAVLQKHWPNVPNLGDIKAIEPDSLQAVDLVCGGFPCQPFSTASSGRRKGKEDDRYLWPEMLRIVKVVRPSWVLCENVAGIVSMALDQVVSDLESSGYEVGEPLEIPACAVGCDHWRARYWVLAYSDDKGELRRTVDAKVAELSWCCRDNRRERKTNGFSKGMVDKAIGNAVSPLVAKEIGLKIMEANSKGVQ